jgi:hypothetical protein
VAIAIVIAVALAGDGGIRMARHGAAKRRKEIARQERQRDKEARRLERRKEREAKAGDQPAVEVPDVAGIVPGPQPPSGES